jgi:hypothetical protein
MTKIVFGLSWATAVLDSRMPRVKGAKIRIKVSPEMITPIQTQQRISIPVLFSDGGETLTLPECLAVDIFFPMFR